jgi:short-chain Z-isoprenyl diphosphate synthase
LGQDALTLPKTRPSLRARAAWLAHSLSRAMTGPLYAIYERRLAADVRHGELPKHLGLILDGNRRYARLAGLGDVRFGHDLGVTKAREVLEWCLEMRIPTVTLWVLSPDNFTKREPAEVEHILGLLEKEARRMAQDRRIRDNRVRVRAIGRIESFPEPVLASLRHLEESTAHHDGMHLNIAVGYGGREEIIDAVRQLLRDATADGHTMEQLEQDLTAEAISSRLYTADQPDPDFIIRTSGEVRLSGFLLWQSAFSEYYFCDVFWPAFRRIDFLRALRDYQARERRFGI